MTGNGHQDSDSFKEHHYRPCEALCR